MPLRLIPNILTMARIMAVIPLVGCMLIGRYDWAFVVAMLAGLSDALDGYLARRFGWQSQFGGWADPAADKLLMSASYLTMAYLAIVPMWLTALVLFRDLVIVWGALVYRQWFGPFQAKPTWLSKLTTLMQLLLIWLVLINMMSSGLLAALQPVGLIAVGVLTTLTLIQYVGIWGHKAWRRHQQVKVAG